MEKVIRLYKIMPVRDGLIEWGEVQKGLLAPLKSPCVQITEVDLPKAPIKEINSAYHVGLVGMLQVEAAIKAEEEGYDAVVLGCLDVVWVQRGPVFFTRFAHSGFRVGT